MNEVSIAVAFAAGVLSFLSPCVLALVPVYLAFLGGAAVSPATAAGGGLPHHQPDARRAGPALMLQAIGFVAGFSVVFIVLGTSLGLVGAPLFRIPQARQVAGVAVIVLGILTTGAFGNVLHRLRLNLGVAWLPSARWARALGLGALVAIGWTPCIGPVLGAILTMGASSGSAPVVALLLTAYSLGLAVPFLAAAAALPRLGPVMRWLRSHPRAVEVVSGMLIVAIGVMIYLNAFARLATLFTLAL